MPVPHTRQLGVKPNNGYDNDIKRQFCIKPNDSYKVTTEDNLAASQITATNLHHYPTRQLGTKPDDSYQHIPLVIGYNLV